jgi:hypothetical protein
MFGSRRSRASAGVSKGPIRDVIREAERADWQSQGKSPNVDRISATVVDSFGEGLASRFSRSLIFGSRLAQSSHQW